MQKYHLNIKYWIILFLILFRLRILESKMKRFIKTNAVDYHEYESSGSIIAEFPIDKSEEWIKMSEKQSALIDKINEIEDGE